MKKWMFIVLMAFVCLAGVMQISQAEDFSVTITPVYGPYWKRTLPWTTEEKVLVQYSFSGWNDNSGKTKAFEVKISIFCEGGQIFSNTENISFNATPDNPGCATGCIPYGPFRAGNYCLQVIVNDLSTGKTVTKEISFEIEEEKNFRLLGLTFIDNQWKSTHLPVCFAGHQVGVMFAFSSAVQLGDVVEITITDKESSLVLSSFNVVNDRGIHVKPFRLIEPGKHILLLKAVDKTKNLEVEYELPVIVVDPREIME
ncbi:MAG: hypothetical protein ACI4UF_03110 [Thermoguttaceae bacterium]